VKRGGRERQGFPPPISTLFFGASAKVGDNTMTNLTQSDALGIHLANDMAISEIVHLVNDTDATAEAVVGVLTTLWLTDGNNLLDLQDINVLSRDDVKDICLKQGELAGLVKQANSKKKLPPFTAEEWMDKAPSFTVDLGGTEIEIKPKAFKSGSFGSFGNGRTTILVDGKEVACSVSMTVVVNNSKLAKYSA
jgi:hypothetical protein